MAFKELYELILFVESRSELVNVDLKNISINGIAKKDPMDVYLANKAISSSNSREVLNTPKSFRYSFNNPKNCKKKCFELGTFCHSAFIEPNLFKQAIVLPEIDMRINSSLINAIEFINPLYKDETYGLNNKSLKDMFEFAKAEKEYSGVTFISLDQKHIIDNIEANYWTYGNGIIPIILSGAVPECSFYWTDKETSLDCRVRPDYFNIEENIGMNAVISYKTTSRSNIKDFISDCVKFNYGLSEAMYLDGLSVVTGRDFSNTIMAVLQTIPPYDVFIVFWSKEDLEVGKYRYRMALESIKECLNKDSYPGFESFSEQGNRGIIEINLPDYSKQELTPINI